MIHRALFGSLERFFAILIEHYGGNFPFWLSPTQVKIIPVADEHNDYAKNILKELRKKDFRVGIDISDNNFGKKVREAKNERVPYFVITGKEDIKDNKLTLESRDGEKSIQISLEELIKKLEIENNPFNV
jgi:threonyl-tRNA synthetase